MAGTPYVNPIDERTPVAEAFNAQNRYWGARFCRMDKVTPWKLLWTTARVKQFTTTLRIFPGKNPDNHVDWDPYRRGTGREDFGDWIRWHWAWRRSGFGNPITFLLHPQRQRDEQNPAVLLYKTVKYAVENNKGAKGHWGAMISEKNNRGSVIGKPKRMFMVQGAVFEHGGTWFDVPKGLGEDDLPTLVDLGSDAAKGVIRACKDRFKPEELAALGIEVPSPDDWYRHGDAVSLDAGRFFEFYPEVAPPPHVLRDQRLNRPAAPAGPMALSPLALRQKQAFRDDNDDEDEGGRDVKGYTVICYAQVGPDEYNQVSPELTAFAEVLEEKVRPWSEVLVFLNYQQQAAEIVNLLRLPDDNNPNGKLYLDVIEKAWVDHRDWWPDPSSDIWAEWVARVSVPGSDLGHGSGGNGAAAAAGPDFRRARPGGAGVIDETLAPDPARSPGPRRLAPPTQVPLPGQEDSAEYFRKIQEEEMALMAAGVRPDFPTPGAAEAAPEAPATAPKPAPGVAGDWRKRLAERRDAAAGAPAAPPFEPQAPAPTPAPVVPPKVRAAPAAASPAAPADPGGEFTAPPTGVDDVIKGRLAAMRSAIQKIPTQ